VKRERLLPLIVATALFIENMDSTAIATSLPQIAPTSGTEPVALKLALTTYLLALAVFIPVSGWVADRFGARRTFVARSRCSCSVRWAARRRTGWGSWWPARFVQGMGGAMMVPVGRLVLLRTIAKAGAGAGAELADGPGHARADAGTGAGRGDHHLRALALHLPDQPADGAAGHLAGVAAYPDLAARRTAPLDWRGFLLSAGGLALAMFGFVGGRAGTAGAGGGDRFGCLLVGIAGCWSLYVRHARRHPHPLLRPGPVRGADLPRRRAGRFAVPHRHRRHAVPVCR
jgi:MFS family permease